MKTSYKENDYENRSAQAVTFAHNSGDWNNVFLRQLAFYKLKLVPCSQDFVGTGDSPWMAPIPNPYDPDPYSYPSLIVEDWDQTEYR